MSRKILTNPYTGETLKEPLIVAEDHILHPEDFYGLDVVPRPSPADLDDDPVNPAHYMSYYKDGIDCITAMKHAFGEEAVQHFCITNAFKYIWRHMSKNGMQDIEKAVWYLNKYLELNK